MVSQDPELQKSRQNAAFFFAVLGAMKRGAVYFQHPDTPKGELYSTLKNIEDYALLPFDGIQDPFTVLWENATNPQRSQIVEYMAKNGRVGANRWAQINTPVPRYLPEPTVPPEYQVHRCRSCCRS
jgi:hypothetical protein